MNMRKNITFKSSTRFSKMSFFDKICKRENGFKWTKRIALVVFVLFVFGFVLFLCFRASSSKISRTSAFVQNYNDEPKLPLLKYNNPSVVTEKVQKQENVSWSYSNDCQTEFCQDYSKILSKHMDTTTDPCEDFHQCVCGNWDSNSRTAFYQMQVDIYGTVLVALSNTKRSKSKAVQYVLDLYKEFVDKRTRTKVDLRSIRQMQQKVLGRGQWPLPASVSTLSWSDQAKISNQFDQFWDSDSASSIKSKLDRTEYLIDFKQFWDSWKSWKLQPDHMNSSLDNTANVNQWMDWYVEMLMIHYQPLVSITSWDVKAQKMKANEISLLKVEVTEDIDKLYVNYRGFKKLAMLFMELGELDWGSSLNNAIFEVLDFYTELSSIFPKSMSNSKPETESEQNMKTITLGELKQNYSAAKSPSLEGVSCKQTFHVVRNLHAEKTKARMTKRTVIVDRLHALAFNDKSSCGIRLTTLNVLTLSVLKLEELNYHLIFK